MKLLGILFLAVSTSSLVFAFEDMGKLNEARKSHPEIFIPGSVNMIDFKAQPHYVFSGEAEQCFAGEFAEPASELYEEATLSAKNNFFESLTKKGGDCTVHMSGCFVLYQYNNKMIYTVILAVPKANVTITQNPKAAPSNLPQPASAISRTLPQITVPNAPPIPPSGKAEKAITLVPKSNDVKTAVNPPEKTLQEKRVAKYSLRIEKNPEDIISHIRLGELYEQDQQYVKSLSSFQTAVMLIGKSEFFDNDEAIRVILKTAELCEQEKKYNLALKYYNLLLKHSCPQKYYDIATSKISKIRLLMIQ